MFLANLTDLKFLIPSIKSLHSVILFLKRKYLVYQVVLTFGGVVTRIRMSLWKRFLSQVSANSDHVFLCASVTRYPVVHF